MVDLVPTWCSYALNTSPPVSGLVNEMNEEQKLMVKSRQPGELLIWSFVCWGGPDVPSLFWGDSDLSMGLNKHAHCISGLASILASRNGW